jgi:putative transposase
VAAPAISPSDAEPFWTEFLRDLVRRGLSGVNLLLSDAHEGIKAATARRRDPDGADGSAPAT